MGLIDDQDEEFLREQARAAEQPPARPKAETQVRGEELVAEFIERALDATYKPTSIPDRTYECVLHYTQGFGGKSWHDNRIPDEREERLVRETSSGLAGWTFGRDGGANLMQANGQFESGMTYIVTSDGDVGVLRSSLLSERLPEKYGMNQRPRKLGYRSWRIYPSLDFTLHVDADGSTTCMSCLNMRHDSHNEYCARDPLARWMSSALRAHQRD